jgi:hypothetical protein
MRGLEDKVSVFLKPIIDGESRRLNSSQRKALAKWAFKTATVFEGDTPESPRTPRRACEFIREVGVGPTSEVFLARYMGPRILDRFRKAWTRKDAESEPKYAFLTTLLVGQVLIYVVADPWVDWPSRYSLQGARAADLFIPLVGGSPGPVDWPPRVAIGEGAFESLTQGLTEEMRTS